MLFSELLVGNTFSWNAGGYIRMEEVYTLCVDEENTPSLHPVNAACVDGGFDFFEGDVEVTLVGNSSEDEV